MGRGRNWTEKEEEYLEENWGSKSIPVMAKALKRTTGAVYEHGHRKGLGRVLDSGDYVTMHTLLHAIGYVGSGSYKAVSWIEKRGFPVKMHRVLNSRFKVVYLDDFWEWAEKNRSFINFAKFPKGALGIEPKWVKEQRRKDLKACALQRKDKWTRWEDMELISLVKAQKWTYRQISEKLGRTDGAINHRLKALGIPDRPVREWGNPGSWMQNERAILEQGILNGDCYAVIGARVNRSEKAVRGFAFRLWGTENMDRIREMLREECKEA